MSHLHVYLFGPPLLRRDGTAVALDARKTAALLAYLAVTETSHSRETLMALLWPELEPKRAQNVLRRNLSTLNRALNGEWIVVDGDVIGLDNEVDVTLDVAQFRQLAACGQHHDHAQAEPCDACMDNLADAAALYRADFLAGFGVRHSPTFDNWQLLEAQQLRRELAAVLERLVVGYARRDAVDTAVGHAQRWLVLDPLREQVHRCLMRLYAQKGDRSAALRQYQLCRQQLQDELGVEPEHATTQLYQRLRVESPVDIFEPTLHIAAATKSPTVGPPPPSPYRGLFSFREEDAASFFGRDLFVCQLIDGVQKRDMIAVIGPSGSGKSSVVFAGLVPALRRAGGWIIVPFRPGEDPFLGVAHALLPHLEPDLTEVDALVETQKLARSLASGELALAAVVGRILQKNDVAVKLLLVTDQFEELYTLCQTAQLRNAFLETLFDTLDAQRFGRERHFGLLFTLRADFMEQALAFRPLADAVQDAALMLGPMLRTELSEAVQRPADALGVEFEAGLVERILDDVGESPGNLPLLEFALAMLWEQQENRLLTHAGYENIARVEGALTRHADQVVEALTPDEQELARHTFIQLVRPGEGTEDTRRVARREELGDADWELVQHLADARLVVTGRDAAGSETVEVVHEALIGHWRRFREWMEADRTFRAWQERLRASMRQWEASDYNEGALLRGVPLAEAEGWLAERGTDLGVQEAAFIQTSIELREQLAAEREESLLARERLRQRILQGLLAGVAVMLLLLGLTGWQYLRAEEQRQAANSAQSRMALERDQAQMALSRQLATQAAALQDEQLDLSLLLSVEANRIAETVDARRSLRSALAANARLEMFFHGHTDRLTAVAYSPDGRLMASGSNDNSVRVWDVASGQAVGLPLHGHSDNVLSVDFSPDSQMLASGGADRQVVLWDAATGQSLGQPLSGYTTGVSSVAFSPDGTMLATSGGGDILLWDLTGSEPISKTLSGHTARVRSVAFRPDGQVLASGGDDESVRLWDVAGASPLARPLMGHENLVRSVAFSADGEMLASASEDGMILLWDVAGEPMLTNSFRAHDGSVRSVAFSPALRDDVAGDVLASAGTDDTVRLWDVVDARPLGGPLAAHSDWVRDIAFSPDGQQLASASHDGRLILWHVGGTLADPLVVGAPLTAHLQGVRTVALSPDSQMIASGSDDETIILWDANTGQPLAEPLRGHSGAVRSVAFSPDGRVLASGSDDQTIVLWDVLTREMLGEPLVGHTGSVRSVAFSPDGRMLASGSKDETVMVWNTAVGQPLSPPIVAHARGVQKVAFDPNGRFVASAGDDRLVKLWRIDADLELASTLAGHGDVVFGLAFSPDGQTLASSSWDKTILLWDVAGGSKIGLPLTGHMESVQDVAFGPDGVTLASGGWDTSVMLWDVVSGLPLTAQPPLTGHAGSVRSVAISQNGRLLVSGSDDGSILRWDIDPVSWQARACRRANRNLSEAEWQQYFGEQPYAVTCPALPQTGD